MSVLRLSNAAEWRAVVVDKEARACLRRVVLSTLSDLGSYRVAAYRKTVEMAREAFKKQGAKVAAIDAEVGCIVSLLERLPDAGEPKEFRRMMEEKRQALLKERGEMVQALDKAPDFLSMSERLLKEVEGQVANAEFLKAVIEEADNAEGGVPGVEHEPRGPGGDGAPPDAARNG